jgi:hypothetical protein
MECSSRNCQCATTFVDEEPRVVARAKWNDLSIESVKWRWESETKQCYKHPEPLAYVSRLSTTFILHRP